MKRSAVLLVYEPANMPCSCGAGQAREGLRAYEAIAEDDTLLLTVPNQLGTGYNA
jgi:hypothetical protein